VLHQSTAWFTCYPRDSRADPHSFGATTHGSSSSSSTTVLLSLHNSREQLGHHSRSPPMGYPCYNHGKVGHFTKECRLPRQANSPRTPSPMATQQKSQQRVPVQHFGCANLSHPVLRPNQMLIVCMPRIKLSYIRSECKHRIPMSLL
jgi:hypothetical protein